MADHNGHQTTNGAREPRYTLPALPPVDTTIVPKADVNATLHQLDGVVLDAMMSRAKGGPLSLQVTEFRIENRKVLNAYTALVIRATLEYAAQFYSERSTK